MADAAMTEDTDESEAIRLPLDLQIEVFLGLLMGIMGTINKYTANLDSISHQEIMG